MNEKTIDFLKEIGYDPKTIASLKKDPRTSKLTNNEILQTTKDKLTYFNNLGLTHQQYLKVINEKPSLLGLDIEIIDEKIKCLNQFNYDEEEIKQIILNLPSILLNSKENLEKKIEYLNSINLSLITLEKTEKLIQGVDLTYARYEFFKDQNIKINKDNCGLLFTTQSKFEKRYKITKQKILNKYNYERDYNKEQPKTLTKK